MSNSRDMVLAKIDGEKITEKDFIAALDSKEQQIYLQFKKQRLDKIIAQKLLEHEAKRRQVSLEVLLAGEVFDKADVDHEAVHAYYKKNKKQFKGKDLQKAEEEIENLLKNEKSQIRIKKLLAEITTKAKIKYLLMGSKK